MPPFPNDERLRLLGVYQLAVGGLIHSKRRFLSALAAVSCLRHSWATAHADTTTDHVLTRSLRRLSVEDEQYFYYITTGSYFVYRTTILDTFLTDTTQFLLQLHPASLGSRPSLSVAQALAASSLQALVTDAAHEKARSISFQSFPDRIAFLEKTFGLTPAIDAAVSARLAGWADLRNQFVHNQSSAETYLDVNGRVEVRSVRPHDKPTPVGYENLDAAAADFDAVEAAVYRAVVVGVIGLPATDTLSLRFTSCS